MVTLFSFGDLEIGILTLIFLLPILAAFPTWLVGRIRNEFSKYFALIISGLVMILAVFAWLMFENSSFLPASLHADRTTLASGGFTLVEEIVWIDAVGMNYSLGIDGLSLPLVLLAGFIFLVAVLASFKDIENRQPAYYAMLMLLETGVIGTFVATDFIIFYIAWELVLVPMFFLIGIWGGEKREYAAIYFFIYTHVASLVMLLGIIGIWLESANIRGTLGGSFSFNILSQLDFGTGPFILLVFLALLFGFIVKVPSVPFHTWLPLAHVEAPTPGSMILAGLLLKMGGYGLLRVSGWLLPEAMAEFAWLIAIIGLISLLYGSWVALRQVDMKSLVAYSSVGHMGIVLLGVATQTPEGFAGAMYMQIAHGIISPLMFFLAGTIGHSAHTRDIPKLKGFAKKMPLTAGVLVFGSFASAGLPGLAGFWSELLAFVALFNWEGQVIPGLNIGVTGLFLAMIGVLGIIFTAAYYLWMLQRTVFGDVNPELEHAHDISHLSQYLTIAFLCFFVLLLGIFPSLLLDLMTTATNFFGTQFI
ncbi:MAG: NADH-quinone oxidoreductase subunit M [Candidatus Heimdallarchaeota archaeon]|nr:NADH-quinone oxidoreductase subunit M [Candidatus Heimdallarchaeota archaeon]